CNGICSYCSLGSYGRRTARGEGGTTCSNVATGLLWPIVVVPVLVTISTRPGRNNTSARRAHRRQGRARGPLRNRTWLVPAGSTGIVGRSYSHTAAVKLSTAASTRVANSARAAARATIR